MIQEQLATAIEEFNQRAETEESFRKDIAGLTKTIVIEIPDEETYHMRVENDRMGDLGTGALENPDIYINSSKETMEKLLAGDISAIKAYATKKLKVKATLKDIMIMRKIFS